MPNLPPILRIHHAGDWLPDQVRTSWVTSSYIAPPDVQRAIDDAWERAMLEPNRQLFDGPMCRLEGCVVDDKAAGDRVDVSLSRTSYRVFWGTNIMHPELADRHGTKVMANPIGVSPALETSDGYLLLGRRNALVAYYPSRLHPFAGCLEPGDRGENVSAGAGALAPDPFAAIYRELNEELRLAEEDVELIRLTGVVEDVRLRQPELIFRVKSRLPRATIEGQVDKAEHLNSIAIAANPRDVSAALRDPAMTPVAIASLLLWGKLAFGGSWFDAEAARVTGRQAGGTENQSVG